MNNEGYLKECFCYEGKDISWKKNVKQERKSVRDVTFYDMK